MFINLAPKIPMMLFSRGLVRSVVVKLPKKKVTLKCACVCVCTVCFLAWYFNHCLGQKSLFIKSVSNSLQLIAERKVHPFNVLYSLAARTFFFFSTIDHEEHPCRAGIGPKENPKCVANYGLLIHSRKNS